MKYNNDRTDIWWPAAGQYNNDLAGPISGCQISVKGSCVPAELREAGLLQLQLAALI